jgi:galactoside O-acetyltransferase
MKSDFYGPDELKNLGFKNIGRNVLVSRKASIYGSENIELGSNIRIDDFCVLSGKIKLHNNIHIACFCALFAGEAGIEIMNYSGLSSRVAIYAVSDDFSGNALSNPTFPDKYRKVISMKVTLYPHSIIGTGTTILPGCDIAEGSAVGAMSLVTESTEPWGTYYGIPAKRKASRSKRLLELEKQYLKELGHDT